MSEKGKMHDILSQNIMTLMNNDEHGTPSMRYLSTCIEANDGYIQKIVNGTSYPSMDKLIEIANHFDVEPWTLLYDSTEKGEEFQNILYMLASCPHNMLPTIQKYIEFLLELQKTD